MTAAMAGGRNSVNHYYGKYRGKVLDNFDPLMLGRIIPSVPALAGMLMNWATPCVPYAGFQVGFYFIPPIGANVWIEFEAGDPTYPIWSGCFWAEGEVPIAEGPPEPLVKVLSTEFIKIVMSDLPEAGGLMITVLPPATNTPMSMTFTSAGIEINAVPAIITMIPEEGITITYPPCVQSMTAVESSSLIADTSIVMTAALTEIESPAINMTAEADVSLEAGALLTLGAGADMSLEVAGAIEITAGLAVEIEAGAAVDIQAAAAITLNAAAAIEISAVGAIAIEAALACDITGGATVAITGASVELLGIVTADGFPLPSLPI